MREARARRAVLLALFLALGSALSLDLFGVDRVPRPEFSSGYQEPLLTTPPPRSEWLQYLDVLVLGLALAAAGWLGIRARSRIGIFLLGALSIGYFGFFRKGCICPIGSLQNIALSLADPGYVLPFSVVAFFALPLVAALLAGREYCSGVCPFGALQDAVVIQPLRLPRWLTATLGLLPVVYLSLAVLFAACGAGFVVCRFDPFISFFRLGGSATMLALGASLLVLGTVVARPYCRFLCPFGLILGWLSRLSWRHATIAPRTCVQCRLCEEACPVDAIRPPAPAVKTRPTRRDRRAFAVSILALPALVALGAYVGFLASPYLAASHPTVRLALQIQREDSGATKSTTLESETFRSKSTPVAALEREAAQAAGRFALGTPIAAGFIMLVFGLRALSTFIRPRRSEFEMDRTACVGCGRCFSYCPQEHARLNLKRTAAAGGSG